MNHYIAAVALTAALVQSASAITFSSLTTIYVGSGVRDSGDNAEPEVATTFHCSNVSGVSTTVRFLVLNELGSVEASFSSTVSHGQTVAVSTRFTAAYPGKTLSTGPVGAGVVNIEALQSGVFCNGKTIDAEASAPVGVPLPLVRINPHPGSVE